MPFLDAAAVDFPLLLLFFCLLLPCVCSIFHWTFLSLLFFIRQKLISLFFLFLRCFFVLLLLLCISRQNIKKSQKLFFLPLRTFFFTQNIDVRFFILFGWIFFLYFSKLTEKKNPFLWRIEIFFQWSGCERVEVCFVLTFDIHKIWFFSLTRRLLFCEIVKNLFTRYFGYRLGCYPFNYCFWSKLIFLFSFHWISSVDCSCWRKIVTFFFWFLVHDTPHL